MKTIIFLVLVNLSFFISAQTKYTTVYEDFILFHENISAGERMFKNDSLLQAYAKFDNAIVNYKGAINSSHYYKAALCALKIKEEFKALNYLEKAIVNGFVIDSAKKDEIVFFNLNTKKDYLDNIAKWESSRDAVKNTTWIKELYASEEAGKKYTITKYKVAIDGYLACLKSKTCSKTSPEFLSKYKIVKEKIIADSTIAAILFQRIKQYGFPNLKLLDKKSYAIAHNILLNYDVDKTNDRLDNILSRALVDAEISPEFYATLIDRRNLMNGLSPTFYEPVTGYEKTIGKDLLNANKNRRTIGLYPISPSSLVIQKIKDPKAVKPHLGLYDY